MTPQKEEQATLSLRRRRRREEQLELDLAPISKVMPSLVVKRRAPARSDSRLKRLRHGVLVQQFLK